MDNFIFYAIYTDQIYALFPRVLWLELIIKYANWVALSEFLLYFKAFLTLHLVVNVT